MDRPANMRAQVFPVLFPAAVGCLLGSLVIDFDFAFAAFDVAALTVALVFSLAGITLPVSVIKKPFRSYRFLSGIGRSPLSRQVLLVGLFGVLLLVHWALALAGNGAVALGVVTAVTGGAALLAIGLTYWLRSQPGWRHWSTLASLFGGALAGGMAATLVVALAWPESLPAYATAVRVARALVILGAAVLAVAIVGRSVYLSRGGARPREALAITAGIHRGEHLAAAGFVIVTLIAAAVSYLWPWTIVAGFFAALAAQYLQWRLFFVTAVPTTWRTEVRWSLPLELAGKGR